MLQDGILKDFNNGLLQMETPAEYNLPNQNPLADRVFKSIFVNTDNIEHNSQHADDIKPVFVVITNGTETHCNDVTFFGSSRLIYNKKTTAFWIETNNKILID